MVSCSLYRGKTRIAEMNQKAKNQVTDSDIRHFIYKSFAKTSRPPTTLETAEYFKTARALVENAFESLANEHHIALAPGTHSIWMAHPFSGLPTNFLAEVDGFSYWGN
jgi:hypothetical protein